VNQHIVQSYDQELRHLTDSIVIIGELVKDMFLIQKKAINEPGVNYAPEAEALDLKINKYDFEIEQLATILIATRQPLAIDLRQITSAIKIAVIMERMGDLAKNIIWRVSTISDVLQKDVLADINKMTEILISMLEKIISSVKTLDVNYALSVIEQDAYIDSIYLSLVNKLTEIILSNQAVTKSMMQLIIAIKNIERLGDYVTKVAKILYYIVTGDVITTQST
jgi:phosphate transport system protein